MIDIEAVIDIEVVYAEPRRSIVRCYRLPARARLCDALAVAAADPAFAGVAISAAGCGVFGKAAGAQQPLQQADRVEIYRPLPQDPKTARRNRVNKSGRS